VHFKLLHIQQYSPAGRRWYFTLVLENMCIKLLFVRHFFGVGEHVRWLLVVRILELLNVEI
jgi:hypothetical protein